MNAAVLATVLLAAEEEFNPDDVTPGVWGFVITFLIMAAVLLLVLDMVRRIRRVNYRAEVREQLEAEQAAEAAGGSPAGAGDASNGSAAGEAVARSPTRAARQGVPARRALRRHLACAGARRAGRLEDGGVSPRGTRGSSR